jgi:hypothetical protein
MENKQTAVEWFADKIDYLIPFVSDEHAKYFNSLIEQAKEMEKQQIIEAYQKGVIDGYGDSLDFSNCSDAENYYKQKYGDNK